MDMILWIIVLVLTVVFLALMILVWFRKLQFDAVHRNFLDLEDKFGGKVMRAGFAVRPRYTGEFKGQRVTVSITYENTKDGRKYYIAATMQCASKVNFTVMSTEWLERREIPDDKKRSMRYILGERFLIETPAAKLMKKLNIPSIEKAVQKIAPFAYILIAKSGIVLERISTNIVEDTQLNKIEGLFEGMYLLKTVVE